MPHDDLPAVLTPQICQRYSSLVWYCLDADLPKSALFYAERYYVLDPKNHDARHLYATALLHAGQPHSAHKLVNLPQDTRCTGCVEIIAECCVKLGRHRQAREAFETCLQDPAYTPSRTWFLCDVTHWRVASVIGPHCLRLRMFVTESMSTRTAKSFPDPAVLHCLEGNSALKGNLHDSAARSFERALLLNPMLWEAFEGLCAIGACLRFSQPLGAQPELPSRPDTTHREIISDSTGTGPSKSW